MTKINHLNQNEPMRLTDILRPDQNSFGVIRLAMAIVVLISHSYFFVSGTPANEPLHWLTGHSLGEHGVQVFFFLSGILVTESLLRSRSLVTFVCGRVLRIFPALIVCVLLTAVVLGPIVSHKSVVPYFADPQWLSYIAKTVLLITGAAPLPGTFAELPAVGLVNLSLWTLKFEVLCYIGLGMIGAAGLLRERFRLPTTVLLAAIVFTVFLRSPDPALSYSQADNVRYFALYFGMGTLACLLKDHLVIERTAVLPLFALFLAAIGTPWAELSCALFLGYATLIVATFNSGPLRSWCNERDTSYGVYIYAAPTQQGLLQLYPGFGPLALAAVAMAISLILAYLSWTHVEKPAMAMRGAVGALTDRLLTKSTQQVVMLFGGQSSRVERRT